MRRAQTLSEKYVRTQICCAPIALSPAGNNVWPSAAAGARFQAERLRPVAASNSSISLRKSSWVICIASAEGFANAGPLLKKTCRPANS